MSEIALTHIYRGKVRDLYDADPGHLLMVASDRLSAFDVVMGEEIPHKGRVLTAFTDFWVEEMLDLVPSALVSCDPRVIAAVAPQIAEFPELWGRTSLVRKAEMLPLECIVRGRLAGSAFAEYQENGTVHRMPAPKGLRLTDPFPEPIFTPSTKADEGHDENIDLARAAGIVGADVLEQAQTICLEIFTRASERMASVGLILADTKFELGYVDGELSLCDEVITPDSSRIWPADQVEPGVTPPAFDKQPFRDWLAGQGWDRTPPAPHVPEEIVAITSRRYVEAYERVTGKSLDDWYGQEQ